MKLFDQKKLLLNSRSRIFFSLSLQLYYTGAKEASVEWPAMQENQVGKIFGKRNQDINWHIKYSGKAHTFFEKKGPSFTKLIKD